MSNESTFTIEETNENSKSKSLTCSLKTSQKIYLPFKRLISIFGSIIGIIFCTLLIWWWVLPINLMVTKGHPFFNRHRIGKNGKAFIVFKFRTMRLDTDPHMSSTGNDVSCNITGFGKFLRATSIDETVQLFNILIGQMAFIGPRPLIDVNSEDVITINKRKENGSICLKPGLSGYAQIHKRGELDPSVKAEYDRQYLERFSFWLDAKIFLYTILKAFGAVKGR